MDDAGEVVTFAGGQWSAPVNIASEFLGAISCGSLSFCVAIGGPAGFSGGVDAYSYNGSTWSGTTLPFNSSNYYPGVVSCPTTTECIALFWGAPFGRAQPTFSAVFDGATWTTPVGVPDGNGFLSLSCPTVSFCVGGDASGNVTTFNGSSWSTPVPVDPPTGDFEGGITASCASPSYCVGIDSQGDAATFNGSAWSSPTPVIPGDYFDSVSCPTEGKCLAIGDQGTQPQTAAVSGGPGIALTLTNGSWSPPTGIDDEQNGMESVSCPTSTFCAATDRDGHVLTYSGG